MFGAAECVHEDGVLPFPTDKDMASVTNRFGKSIISSSCSVCKLISDTGSRP